MKRWLIALTTLLLAGCSGVTKSVSTYEYDSAAQVAAAQGTTVIITTFLIVVGVIVVALIALEMVSQWRRRS